MQRKFLAITLIMITLAMLVAPLNMTSGNAPATQNREIYQTVFESGDFYLKIELWDDDLAHFEFGVAPAPNEVIWTSPMILKTDYPGVSSVITPETNIIETPELRLEIDESTLCITSTDLTRTPELVLTTTCPQSDSAEDNSVGLTFTPEGITDVYGLGEYFQRRGGAIGNLYGQRRLMLNPFGNDLMSFNGGNVGDAQFPIMYALGEGTDNYAVFVDHVYAQFWNFRIAEFSMQTSTLPLRWFLLTGDDLPDLRHDYMELTGHPPVPPKQMLGLWVSEFGYEDWDELTDILAGLRTANFPVDGFVLDLLWFGGFDGMGSLTWDTDNFPEPEATIAALREEYGLGIMTIEEPYVNDSLPEYVEAENAGVLVRECADAECDPVYLNSWWGEGSMVDFTNPDATVWWHTNRRQPLIDTGVMAHWTDLGEPEDYDELAWYYGLPELDRHAQADIHNLYNFFWSQSIWDGYAANEIQNRPFILSRSGTSGSQRFGVAMWSGDIGANMPSLATHLNAQMNISLSGIDYFGADIGGFYRHAGDILYDGDDMYTIWMANAALLDVPLRPHAYNVQNQYETSPVLIGETESNLANVRLRYELSPYIYTLAHRAYRAGDPVFAPLVYYFQEDPETRLLGNQKMIGPDLMVAAISDYLRDTMPVYLPAGGWFNYHTHEYVESSGEWIDVPIRVDGILRAPLFVRDGAIIPVMRVNDGTLNMLGQRTDGQTDPILRFNIYSENTAGEFTLIEDDGQTMDYVDDIVCETTITQTPTEDGVLVEIQPTDLPYCSQIQPRSIEVNLITHSRTVITINLTGAEMEWINIDEQSAGVGTEIIELVDPIQVQLTTKVLEITE